MTLDNNNVSCWYSVGNRTSNAEGNRCPYSQEESPFVKSATCAIFEHKLLGRRPMLTPVVRTSGLFALMRNRSSSLILHR